MDFNPKSLTVATEDEVLALARATLPPAGQLIGSDFCPSRSGRQMEVRSPVLMAPWTTVPASDGADVLLAASLAQDCFASGVWSRAGARERKAGLLKLADQLEARKEELAFLEALETGKPYREALSLDVAQSIMRLRWYAELADKTYGETAPPVADRLGLITREPVGTVAAIVPWNFPLMMAITKIAPALAAGNSVILKPAEASSLTALALGHAALEAGLPPGVLQVLTGSGSECGQALASSEMIDALAFTGSTPTGARILASAAASNMKRVSLECGGKSPHVVLDSGCRVANMAEQIAWGICYNQGQVCDAGANLILVGPGHERLVHDIMTCMRGMTIGHPFDAGVDLSSMISEHHLGRVQGFVDRAIRAGATLLTGGARVPKSFAGAYFQPTVLDLVDPQSELFREEVFGPVLGICRVDTAAEAVRLVNRSRFGLAAAVWARDTGEAAQIASQLRVGVASVNTYELGNITTPFGGFRQSGLGRDRSGHALDNYTELKTTWLHMPAAPH
jgi:4-guanidinobutyraldehyde dehydrogenase/NAD-dependent aldehyde dehydrogenase